MKKIKAQIKEEGLGNSSVSKVLALPAQRPESNLQNPHQKAGHGGRLVIPASRRQSQWDAWSF